MYNLPTPEHIFGLIDGAPVISRLDLRQSFHQIPLAQENRPKLAFWWRQELWQYKIMPMGHKNSSQKMQRILDYEIRKAGLQHCCHAYLDDLIIWSQTVDQHTADLEKVFLMLHSCGLRSHPQKTLVCANVLEFIGFNVGPFGLSPSEAKVAAVKALPYPTCVKELQSVLGFLNFPQFLGLYASMQYG